MAVKTDVRTGHDIAYVTRGRAAACPASSAGDLAPVRRGTLPPPASPILAGGTEAKIVTGIDDHSRYCVICQVVARVTGRAV